MDYEKEKKPKLVVGRSLINIVFSWSLKDVLNTHMYKNQVKRIPRTFSSTTEYLSSFTLPVVEETHADMLSSMDVLARSPCRLIQSFKITKDFKLPRDLFYSIVLKPPAKEDNLGIVYEPETGDLLAITDLRPQNANDLEKYSVIAYVQGVKEDGITLTVLLSKPISADEYEHVSKKSPNLFITCLLNMTTNIRIWQALTCDRKLRNMKVIETVLQTKSIEEGKCNLCAFEDASSYSDVAFRKRTGWSGLNESQQNAVLSCVGLRKCRHECTVKLVWGPPGTGKTNTVGFMLQSLLAMKRRTLTCAPTNIAIMEVTERLVKRVRETGHPRGYGFGNVVLFGNSKRMKIDKRDELQDVFLDSRIDVLTGCFASKTGWGVSLMSVISLLDDPLTLYDSYLQAEAEKSLLRDVSESDGEEKPNALSIFETMKRREKKETDGDKNKEGKNVDRVMFYEEFVRQNFDHLVSQLSFCVSNLCKHLPTSVISLQMAEKMFEADDALKSFQKLLHEMSVEELSSVFSGDYAGKDHLISELRDARMKTVSIMKLLPPGFPIPAKRKEVVNFFLGNACLVFCTVSSAAKLHINGVSPWELLIIDEAAQLKECESTIPLQLPGICQAVLIGDERQLPAMVKSKICEEADYGRSLFERLASLGHKKHLLNVQHRMHPSISLFPNKEFYEGKILDGQNVRLRSHNKRFLQGKMFDSYSFINVKHGSEVVGNNHSTKNMVEVSVVSEIIASLYKDMKSLKKKVRVGVISPYKAQVYAITESLGTSYSDPQSDFFVSVRSVDGFQGGEEDVIIISTVRSNFGGSVGFLSNRQRANVALTRARHCLWIVGNGPTLSKSRSVWKKLIDDAKERRCFHEADEHKGLARAMVTSFVELNQIRSFPNLISLLFRDSMWTVHFDDGFWSSMARVRDSECCKEVLWLVQKISGGWRESQKGIVSNQIIEHYRVKQRRLIWAVDTDKGTSFHTQILKVYGIVEPYEVARLSRQLDKMFRSYSPEKIRRCKYRNTDGNLAVPMTWPVDSISEEADWQSFVSKSLSSLSLEDKPETSSARIKQVEEVSSVGVKGIVGDSGESSLAGSSRVEKTSSETLPHGFSRVEKTTSETLSHGCSRVEKISSDTFRRQFSRIEKTSSETLPHGFSQVGKTSSETLPHGLSRVEKTSSETLPHGFSRVEKTPPRDVKQESSFGCVMM